MNLASFRTLVVAGLLAGFAAGLGHAQESDPTAWDAAWVGGWDGGKDSQVVIADGAVTGFFWNGENFTVENSTNLADGQPIKFIWPGGDAIVQMGPHGELLLLIHEKDEPDIGFILTRQSPAGASNQPQ